MGVSVWSSLNSAGGRWGVVVGLPPDEARRDDPCVWRLDGRLLHFAVFSDTNFAEEDLVQESAPEVACGQVGFQGLLDERQRICKTLIDVGELDL
jgi:hypothetical protein